MRLTIENISKEFKDKKAVTRFSAELTEGVYALLGPNGAGKTTLMRMLADILKPSSGRILLNGKDISLMGDNYRDILGYLPQEFGLYKNFTAVRFLSYFASLKGLDKKEAVARVEEVLELVNLQKERKRKLGTYSGGMKRRLGIAQALLNDPKILIVDEPTAGLDPQERVRFRNLLSEIAGDRIVLLSTHIVSDIEYIAKEVLLMRQGELIQRSKIERLLESVKGKVWKGRVGQEELSKLQRSHKVGNIQRGEKGIEVRIVSDEKPMTNAVAVSPTLEDVYLYFFEREVEGVV
ncbi:ABC transporter ATP-binding protein [Anaerobacillus alkalidiazotrophicus]|uniref:ABC transporter ATP-binding protein n=1 Tax=Anaerobacillus alkalidiazotrophicus TaxID=472963 RepID=A0A1S2M9K1_9BACI|nr:ABC transporter ATP-binding protein [Anaerobacillus alkalidiazotrophicus]OIJ21294.1 ABC transporter ATP-binding protein [Anaerobacillus alkalidiazotrophicus]